MTDRELLEAAARAAGMFVLLPPWPRDAQGWFYNEHSNGGGMFHSVRIEPRWNPLEDDGDALRLAVKLGMELYSDDEATHTAFAYARVRGAGDDHIFEPVVDDACKALRRAIVRAAAALAQA